MVRVFTSGETGNVPQSHEFVQVAEAGVKCNWVRSALRG